MAIKRAPRPELAPSRAEVEVCPSPAPALRLRLFVVRDQDHDRIGDRPVELVAQRIERGLFARLHPKVDRLGPSFNVTSPSGAPSPARVWSNIGNRNG